MQTEFTDTAFSTEARIVRSQSVDRVAFTSEDEAADDRDIWILTPPQPTPIWPRVWPGL